MLAMEFCCSLKESSPDDPPRANIAGFFEGAALEAAVAEAISAEGMDEGADKSGIDRYEEETCDGEKPRTTLVVLRSELQLTESEAAELGDWLEDESRETDLLSMVAGTVASSGAGCGIVCSGIGAR